MRAWLIVAAVLAATACGGCGSSGSRIVLVYQGRPTAQSKVDAASLARAVAIMRMRVKQLGVAHAEIRRSGAYEITLALPDTSNAARAAEVASKTAQLYFYDWEPNVIGGDGRPAPTDEAVTGGPEAGGAQFGLPEYQAVLRAAKRRPIIRAGDTTLTTGCTSHQLEDCIYGDWYLLDTRNKLVLRGPAETEHSLYSGNYTPPAAAVAKAVRVNPGTILVQARPVESYGGKITQASPNSWYVLNDDPALTGADLKNPQQSFEETGEGPGQPIVTFDFTPRGETGFHELTKEVARRGTAAGLRGLNREDAMQHFGVVMDGQLVTNLSIDYDHFPDGIDASRGSQVEGAFTVASAQNFADELRFGALPIRLVLISRTQSPAS